jgi:ABC-type uncharacterized transport system YnjBCD ATPase subunit
MQDPHALTGGGRARVGSTHVLHADVAVMQCVHPNDESDVAEGQDMQDPNGRPGERGGHGRSTDRTRDG